MTGLETPALLSSGRGWRGATRALRPPQGTARRHARGTATSKRDRPHAPHTRVHGGRLPSHRQKGPRLRPQRGPGWAQSQTCFGESRPASASASGPSCFAALRGEKDEEGERRVR